MNRMISFEWEPWIMSGSNFCACLIILILLDRCGNSLHYCVALFTHSYLRYEMDGFIIWASPQNQRGKGPRRLRAFFFGHVVNWGVEGFMDFGFNLPNWGYIKNLMILVCMPFYLSKKKKKKSHTSLEVKR